MNFNFLGLKKLICTCYDGSPIAHTELDNTPAFQKDKKMPYMIEITEVKDLNNDGAEDMSDIELLLRSDKNTLTILDGDGDFRSEESIEFLKEADIVVTNPPFSLFREYIAQLIKYEKKFIVLSNMNAITYKEIFPLIKNNKMWVGYGFNMSMVYRTPYPNLLEANRQFVRQKGYNPDDGFVKVPAIAWFTNLDTQKRHEELILYKKYNPDEYPKYDNYDAINVDKVSDIPYDYDGVMGVPITFLDKYSPDQFEIIGLAPERLLPDQSSLQNKRYKNAIQHDKNGYTQSGNKVNDGPTLIFDNPPKKFPYYTSETVPGKFLQVLYARILIKRRKTNEN